MRKVLNKNFFNRDALTVAEELLGKYIVRKKDDKEIAVEITETEAYDGHKDKASHAHKGKTARNMPMFGDAGAWYVYLVYGMHEMLNIVTDEKEYPAAVLIRGAQNINGPGKLTKYLKINRDFNNKKADKKTKLWIEDRGVQINKKDVQKTPRIGVEYAGALWAGKKYRFVLQNLRSPTSEKTLEDGENLRSWTSESV